MMYEKRGLYVDDAHLEAFAENYARSLSPNGTVSGKVLSGGLRRNMGGLTALHGLLSEQWEHAADPPGAVRWLLDNFWLIQREGARAQQEFSRAGQLRSTDSGTVLVLLCSALLRSGLGSLSDRRLLLFLSGFQKSLILEREELTHLSAGLKYAVFAAMERLYRTSDTWDAAEAEREAAALFTILRELSNRDFSRIAEQADLVEQTLRSDPAGVYPRMTERSRAAYRYRLSRLALRRGIPEYTAAKKVLTLAAGGSGITRHVGWWILREPLGEPAAKRSGRGYIAANILLTLFLSMWAGYYVRSLPAFFLLLIPVSELVKQTVDYLLLRFSEPVHLPRLALEEGIPPEGRTLCVISVLLTAPASGQAAADGLERAALLNRDGGENLLFALSADLPESSSEPLPGQAQILESAANAVRRLNARYGERFFLLTRPRSATPDGTWAGWERKRGALSELMRHLRGQNSSIRVAAGNPAALNGIRYLLVLDSDTVTAPGAAKELVGAMLHPLCKPVIDEKRNLVTAGHAILAPRLGVSLEDACRTDFSRIFAGQGGTDPYGGDCSELNMDLFGRSGFAGKGIVDIDAYLTVLGGRIPERAVLSHDAVEGAFLRPGFMGDLEFCDGFPGSVTAYYRRLERWTRGDWQNLIWLFRRGRQLPSLERWRLFDSLRRSLVPVLSLTAVVSGFLFRGPGLTLAACAALLTVLSELLLAGVNSLRSSGEARGVRYHSAVFVGFGGGLVRAFVRLLLLPAEAWVCLRAILRALWRMTVSHRNMLEWQTAGESQRLRSSLLRCYRELGFSPVLGLLLLLSAPGIIGKTAGLLWITTPLCALLLSLPADPPEKLSGEEREYLLGCAGDTWRYFAEYFTAEEHFLPPDNVQYRPPVGPARRTSPTNIGLALLSALSAIDLGLTDREDGLGRIAGCLETLERLEKWNGHLFNWYDTASCRPLTPRYVSTVDSGNLCACLIALCGGLERLGEASLSRRAALLAEGMAFRPLYDTERKLFYIGINPETGAPSDSRYDLLSSEARLTDYLAVAGGIVDRAHWQRLSRAQKQYGPYRGMASWTGTMFEYLMPELLLPPQKHSLLWESARFCLYVQQHRTARRRLPWGCSESAYAALDAGMVYRYKAHGCRHLALKPGMDGELVLSPYSSFLALHVRPHAAIANLRRLEALGMREQRGFWEALDCTPSRLSGRAGKPKIVRTVMAHHAGMSLCACANLLTGGQLRLDFMKNPAMAAYVGLLQERVPVGGSVLRETAEFREEAPPRPTRSGLWERSETGTDFLRPACCLLAGETASLLVSETGLTRPRWGRIMPYAAPRSPLDREKGISLFWTDDSGTRMLLPDAQSPAPDACRWSFRADHAEFVLVQGELESRITLSLPESDTGERRRISLRNAGDVPRSGTLTLQFRPLLVPEKDYLSHPAFCGLGISAAEKDGLLLLRRLSRGSTGELWMGFAASRPCSYGLSPSAASGRTGAPLPAAEKEYFLTDPLVTVSCPLTLTPGEETEVSFSLGCAYTREDAAECALRILSSTACADLPERAAAVLGMTGEDMTAAFGMLPELCFPTAPGAPVKQEALWPSGISGDLPILCARYHSEADLPRARELMNAHLFLCGCGCEFDLVFLSRDGAAYHRPLQTALSDALFRSGGELLRDAKGGVHLLEEDDRAIPVSLAAVRCFDLKTPPAFPARNTAYRAAPSGPLLRSPAVNPVRSDWGSDHRFMFYVNRSLPPRSWQQMLTNGRFGFLATDCGTGHLWQENAREMQLTPWRCQPHAAEGPERLWLRWSDGQSVSLFASPEDTACRVSFLPGAAVWEKQVTGGLVRTTAFVPPDTDARVLLIEFSDGAAEGLSSAELHWQMELLLSGTPENAAFCRTEIDQDGLSAENVRGSSAVFRALSDAPVLGVTCRRSSALALTYDGDTGLTGEPVFAMKLRPGKKTALVCGCASPEALRALARPDFASTALENTLQFWKQKLNVLRLHSPCDELNRLMNGWCAYQTLACRIMGRSSLYQSGGAFGFRDQLQDTVNLLGLDASLAREQILHSCRHQFSEGDVQHWWHELDGVSKGVRTRCSDDLLWLPWAVCEYVEKTGDTAICQSREPYLLSAPLSDEEKDRYESPQLSPESESVLRHCARALELVMSRGCGPHGLLRIGAGDWNDGFDTVGGESEWLSWFFLHVAGRFGALCDRFGRNHEALDRFAGQLSRSADLAWDGAWYLRGYYASGAPLGSAENGECKIDSIAQSWAMLSGCAEPNRANSALSAACSLLTDRERQLVRLFTPPFSGREHPGYLTAYGPGFRENGGQYTHGALWLVLALFRAARYDEAWELLSSLLPAGKDISTYLCEPYVLAADVYTAAGHEGEGGWSWYTGSAGWMWRIVTEELLGLKLRGGLLYLEPHLPKDWPGAALHYRGHEIAICGDSIRVDGCAYHGEGLPLL